MEPGGETELAGHGVHVPGVMVYVLLGHWAQSPTAVDPYPPTVHWLLGAIKPAIIWKDAAAPMPSKLVTVDTASCPATDVLVPSLRLSLIRALLLPMNA